ncbi:hypothetical protein K0040_03920 [Terrisporobacter petrolearius]|uniref:hypothetical protein n=1 Tax=Terrisporobacter petrolearius TaxID=1460447 RepID=UPI001D169565|nr:hypothetical protein [Terrisporobacter petrolearius]MCC3863459.1 hypothetical protein [Terrisporobacter petrolearius]
MSKEKPELKNGDQTYRVNSDDFGLGPSACEADYSVDHGNEDDDDDGGIPF